MDAFAGLSALAAVALLLYSVHRWRNPRCNGRLPPGSMGLPLVGETFQFFSPDASFDVPHFIRQRLTRYASFFIPGEAQANYMGQFLMEALVIICVRDV